MPSSEEGPSPREACTEACWGTLGMQLQLASASAGCRELLPPEAQGKARYEAHVIAEPGVGAVVDSVTVLEDTIGSAEFSECMVESAPLAELSDPDAPISDSFIFRYTAGRPADNAVDFLQHHPEVVEAHPELAAILERAADAPRSDEDATTFAKIISTDAQAGAAFSEWFTEQGVDLSNVRADP